MYYSGEWPYMWFLDGQGVVGLASRRAMWLALSRNLADTQPTHGEVLTHLINLYGRRTHFVSYIFHYARRM